MHSFCFEIQFHQQLKSYCLDYGSMSHLSIHHEQHIATKFQQDHHITSNSTYLFQLFAHTLNHAWYFCVDFIMPKHLFSSQQIKAVVFFLPLLRERSTSNLHTCVLSLDLEVLSGITNCAQIIFLWEFLWAPLFFFYPGLKFLSSPSLGIELVTILLWRSVVLLPPPPPPPHVSLRLPYLSVKARTRLPTVCGER